MSHHPSIQWLLEGDAAIRWQTLRDLVGCAPNEVEREQRKVALSGWGARLLALQDSNGRWDNGLYTPKWTSTTYTLQLLRGLGLKAGNRQALLGCSALFDGGFWRDGGMNFSPRTHKHSETCISSMVLSAASWFGFDDTRLDALADHVVTQQMADGGWNCQAMPGYGGASHGSFHTTILALEALLDYEHMRPAAAAAARQAGSRGREFLLAHRLFRSHRTGQVVKAQFTRFAYPPRWHYDVLRALDHFRDCGAPRDGRLAEGIGLVEKRRRADGCWPLQQRYPGKTFFEMEPPGQPSRWNTLRALRVLRWWNATNA